MIKRGWAAPCSVAFGLLRLEADDQRPRPLAARRKVFMRLVGGVSGSAKRSPPSEFAKACKLGLEGIVSKREGSFYRSGKSRNWLKTRTRFRQDVTVMPRDWRAIFDRTCATARLIVSRIVSRFASSVIRPNGQRDHPRLIGCERQGLKQVRFISSQAQDAVLSDLTAIVLEALHQFAGPRVLANAFHVGVSCWG
jgi:hypothetical protein